MPMDINSGGTRPRIAPAGPSPAPPAAARAGNNPAANPAAADAANPRRQPLASLESSRGDAIRQSNTVEQVRRRRLLLATREQAKDLGSLLTDAPKYAIMPDAKKPLTMTGNTFPQHTYLDAALKDFNKTHDEITERLKARQPNQTGGHGQPIEEEEFAGLKMKFIEKAAAAVRAEIAYSFESNSANTRREDPSWAIAKSNVGAVVAARLPLAMIPLVTKLITQLNGEPSDELNKMVVAGMLALALPIAGDKANEYFSESNGGNATRTNLNFRGAVRQFTPEFVKDGAKKITPNIVKNNLPNSFTDAHATGPASYTVGASALGAIVSLVAMAAFVDKGFREREEVSWGQAVSRTSATILVSVIAAGVLEVVKQLAITYARTSEGEDSAHLLERIDHRRDTETHISQTKFKANRSRTNGYKLLDTPRGRTRVIERVTSVLAGLVAGGMIGDPDNITAAERTALTFAAATVTKKATQLVGNHYFNHSKRNPERASLATVQIRVDDIRNSAMEGYIDFSAALANGFSDKLRSDPGQGGFKSAKALLYERLLPDANVGLNLQAAGAAGAPPNENLTVFDIKAFAATAFLFDDREFSKPNAGPKLSEATKTLEQQLTKFRVDFSKLKEAKSDAMSGTSNHLQRQFDYIEKSARSCEGMLARLHQAIEYEYDGVEAQNDTKGPHGFDLYKAARQAIMREDPKTALGRENIAKQHKHISSFCCGALDGPKIKDMDLTKIPNKALGVAAVSVRETLKSEIYELHTRSMLLATNMGIQDYMTEAGLPADASPSAGGDNGQIPMRLLKSLQTLLPLHTGLTNATFEEVTHSFLNELSKVPVQTIKDKEVTKGEGKSAAYLVLSREAGMRPNMTMMADIISRQLNTGDNTPANINGARVASRLLLLRKHVDDIPASRKNWEGLKHPINTISNTANSVGDSIKGRALKKDGIDETRVAARLDLALNLIKSKTSNPSPQETVALNAKHRDLFGALDKLSTFSNDPVTILSRSEMAKPGAPRYAVAKEDFIAHLKAAFADMTHDGGYKLSVETFLKELEDKLGSNPARLGDLKAFISKELPESKDFFELAATELNFIAKKAFSDVTDGIDSVNINVAGSGGRSSSDPSAKQLVAIKQHVAEMKKGIDQADGDVKKFWEGNMATPVPKSTKELKLYELADAHRHQSAFANQHENLVDSYFRMQKIGVKRSVIMPIPTLLNNAGQPVDYYTSATGTADGRMPYRVSALDEREGMGTRQSQGALLFPDSAGEDALFQQLVELNEKRTAAKEILAVKGPEMEQWMLDTGQLPPDTAQKEINDAKAVIQGVNDVFDFYVLSTTVADMANENKAGMEARVLGQFEKSKASFDSYIIKMMGENTFNKINVNSRQPVNTSAKAAENAITIAAQLGRPFNLHSDAARPGDKITWFEEVKKLLTQVKSNVEALDAEKEANLGAANHVPLASKFKVIWSHAGGIAADARDAVDHLKKLRGLMSDPELGKHLLVDISWDKTYTVAMKNFQDYLNYQQTELDDLPKIAELTTPEAKSDAKKKTLGNMTKISRAMESLSQSSDNFSSATTKAHLATRHGLDQTAALSRVAASTPFDLHKEELVIFKDQFKAMFESDENLRSMFMRMIGEDADRRGNNWMSFFVNDSEKIMFGTDALVPYTKVTGEMQYQINALNYYPFFNMIDVINEYYQEPANRNADNPNEVTLGNLAHATENITHGTFDRLIAESDYAAGDKIIDAYTAGKTGHQYATSNAKPQLEEIYKTTQTSVIHPNPAAGDENV